jgi:hypothetical protein
MVPSVPCNVALSFTVDAGQKNPSFGAGHVVSEESAKKFAFEPLSR